MTDRSSTAAATPPYHSLESRMYRVPARWRRDRNMARTTGVLHARPDSAWRNIDRCRPLQAPD